MNGNLPLIRAALCAGMLSASGVAAAYPDDAMGVYGALGRTWHNDGTQAPSIGLIVPWNGWTTLDAGRGQQLVPGFVREPLARAAQ